MTYYRYFALKSLELYRKEVYNIFIALFPAVLLLTAITSITASAADLGSGYYYRESISDTKASELIKNEKTKPVQPFILRTSFHN